MEFFTKHKNIGPLLLRIGLFSTLMFSVFAMKLGETAKVAGVWDKIGLGWLGGTSAVVVVAVILAVLALMILFGIHTRVAGGLLVIFFIVTITQTFGTPVFDKLKVWKDFTLLGAALYFLFAGSGACSLSLKKRSTSDE